MKKLNNRNPLAYREDAMTGPVCFVCGEQLCGEGYMYRGKAVCRACVDFIRTNC